MKPHFHLCLLAVSLCAFLSCQKENEYPAPGYGVDLNFYGLECSSIQVNGGKKLEGYMVDLTVKGNRFEADPIIEQQVRAYYSNAPEAKAFQGGSTLQDVIYCDKVCEGISITASSEVLGRPAGEDLSDAFILFYSNNPFLFDKNLQLIGVLEMLKTTTIQDYLSCKARMLPDMELYLNTSGASLPGIEFAVSVTLEGGQTMTASCTLP